MLTKTTNIVQYISFKCVCTYNVCISSIQHVFTNNDDELSLSMYTCMYVCMYVGVHTYTSWFTAACEYYHFSGL